ncbi:hypothetical protein [uncultured Aquimarina sp.]|uniref:hypothetical protein n=1 Tax=uncultured Aquimarina sp. TaxID=575652 RepID=UPI002618C57B|nr:hypothetical protein [uncultured Aquimarina sp.]
MKKLMLLLFLVGAGVTANAQRYTDAEINEKFVKELYQLATEVGEMTDQVTAEGGVISIHKSKGTVSLARERDKSLPVDIEHYKFKLLTSNGKSIALEDDLMLNKVVDKFFNVLTKVKEGAKQNSNAEIRAILDGL